MLNWPVYYCCPLQQVCVKLNDDFNTPHLHISSLCKVVLTELCASSVKTTDCYIYIYWIACFYYRTTDRASNHNWRSSFSVAAAKRMEQSAAGSDVTTINIIFSLQI